jgi:hypothetical protein
MEFADKIHNKIKKFCSGQRFQKERKTGNLCKLKYNGPRPWIYKAKQQQQIFTKIFNYEFQC